MYVCVRVFFLKKEKYILHLTDTSTSKRLRLRWSDQACSVISACSQRCQFICHTQTHTHTHTQTHTHALYLNARTIFIPFSDTLSKTQSRGSMVALSTVSRDLPRCKRASHFSTPLHFSTHSFILHSQAVCSFHIHKLLVHFTFTSYLFVSHSQATCSFHIHKLFVHFTFTSYLNGNRISSVDNSTFNGGSTALSALTSL